MVYGGLDGTITTFAVVAGVAGASLSSGVVLILGFANLIGDGISMAFGDYLSTKAKHEYQDGERSKALLKAKHHPSIFRRWLFRRYVRADVPKKDAKTLASIIARSKKLRADGLGMHAEDDSPVVDALVTFFSFLGFGFLPLLIYILGVFGLVRADHLFPYATILTGVTMFLLGALKATFTRLNWLKAGLEMLFVGGLAALAAYGIGVFLAGFA